jgi:glycerophosphoryl diester phosphodiesterase
MNSFEIVAHRGVSHKAPENTMQAFERAVELGADAVELDVRLTRDQAPAVFHYFYLDEITDLTGPIFNYTFEQIRKARVGPQANPQGEPFHVASLHEVLETLAGRVGLEIEIKGPEPEAPQVIGKLLRQYRSLWDSMEVTSYEPLLLRAIREQCPGLVVDLLYPRSEPWMKLDVVAYTAIHRARLAGARAVHLHPTQLSPQVVKEIRSAGKEVHAWDVNDERGLDLVHELGLPRVCTDRLEQALAYRARTGGEDGHPLTE